MGPRRVRSGVLLSAVLTSSLVLTACFGSSVTPTTSTTTTTLVQTQNITPSGADRISLLEAFKAHRVAQGAMKNAETVTICSTCGTPAIFEAYDAAQHREYALLYTQFVGSVSYPSQVAAQDGGMTGLFWRNGSRPWIVWTENVPGSPCASMFPAVVSTFWGLQQFGYCKSMYFIPTH